MKKKLVLTTVFAMIFGCVVCFAEPSPRGGRGPEKPKTEKFDKKGGKINDFKKDNFSHNQQKPNKPVAHKPAPKPNHKPVAHKPAPKPNHKPVAHKPAPKPNHKPVVHKPAPKPAPKPACCNKPHHHNCNNVNGAITGAITTAAVIGLIAAIAD